MKKIILKILKIFFAGFFIVFLGTIGIDAVDNHDNMSESLIGRLMFGESKSVCPKNMVFVQAGQSDYCIDKYELSASSDCPHSNPSNSFDSKYNIDSPKCHAISEKGIKPWTNISQNQAKQACMKEGKRLPDNNEWSLAALGTPDPNQNWGLDDCHVNLNWNTQPGLTGSGIKCASYVGAYDMIGNVWEWVDGSVENGEINQKKLSTDGYVNGIDENNGFPSETSAEAQELYNNDYFWIKETMVRTISRGGYWNNKSEAGQYAHYIVSTPTYTGDATGFRCVQNPNR